MISQLTTKYTFESSIVRFCIHCRICRYQKPIALLNIVLFRLGNYSKYSEMFPLWGVGTKWGLWAGIPFYSRGSVFNYVLVIHMYTCTTCKGNIHILSWVFTYMFLHIIEEIHWILVYQFFKFSIDWLQ